MEMLYQLSYVGVLVLILLLTLGALLAEWSKVQPYGGIGVLVVFPGLFLRFKFSIFVLCFLGGVWFSQGGNAFFEGREFLVSWVDLQ